MSVRARRFVTNAALVILAVGVTLGAIEVFFRLFVPLAYLSPLVHVWDKQMSLRQIPGSKGRMVTTEFTTKVLINSKGLRDREYQYAKPPGTRRILCLGDSFTFGYGVEADQTFAKVLERLLNADGAGQARWEVINAGVPGSGTAHQLAYFTFEGYKYEPDYVLVSFCGENDFQDNIRCGLYSLEDGMLVKHDAKLSRTGKIRRRVEHLPGYRAIFRRSHVLMFVGHRVAQWAQKRSAIPPSDTEKIATRNKAAYELTEGLVLGFRDACAARNSELVMTATPLINVSQERGEASMFIEVIKAQGIRYVDLKVPFTEEMNRGAELFYPLDHHWNAMGHRLVGRILCDFFVHASGPGNR